MCAPRITLSNDHQLHHSDNRDISGATRPHMCPLPGCTRQFKRRFTLKEHIKTHSGQKSFMCHVTSAGSLTRHKRIHPWLETTYECPIVACSCTFISETKLTRHMNMVHLGLSTHLCPYANCGCAFSTSGNLRRYLSRHHAHTDSEVSSSETAFAGASKPTACQRPLREISSPIAVDGFAGSNIYDHGQEFLRPSPPPLELSPLVHDGDLLEALSFLFELDASFEVSF